VKEPTKLAKRLQILPDVDDPDVMLVIIDERDSVAIAVIPTPVAHSYWLHPPAGQAPTHPSTDHTPKAS